MARVARGRSNAGSNTAHDGLQDCTRPAPCYDWHVILSTLPTHAIRNEHRSQTALPAGHARAPRDHDGRHEFGQFLTPQPIAQFMASLFENAPRSVQVLDGGAGGGALTAGLVQRLAARHHPPKDISVTAVEIDP